MAKNKLVICPIYNEIKYIKQFYFSLRKFYKEDILFINDGSTDNSDKVLKALLNKDRKIFLVEHKNRQGYGAALLDGFSFGFKKNYQYVVTLDADLQHTPCLLPKFFQYLTKYEVVLGSRYLTNSNHDSTYIPPSRYIINRYIQQLLNKIWQINFSDPFCGFRGYRVEILPKLQLITEKGYAIALEILAGIVKYKLSFKEIPIPLIYNDPARRFADKLNNPKQRLLYYLAVINKLNKGIKNEKEICLSNCQSSS